MRQSRKKWERRREVHRNKLAAVIFVIMMIAFCVVNLATGDREFSATENRALEQRPELTISACSKEKTIIFWRILQNRMKIR